MGKVLFGMVSKKTKVKVASYFLMGKLRVKKNGEELAKSTMVSLCVFLLYFSI